jgi:hypothetical protein
MENQLREMARQGTRESLVSNNLFLLVTRSLFNICLEERKVVIYLLAVVLC